MKHPWALSKIEMQVLTAIVEHGLPEKAAASLFIDRNSLHEGLRRARKKMGVESTLLAAVKFDRWARKSMNTCG